MEGARRRRVAAALGAAAALCALLVWAAWMLLAPSSSYRSIEEVAERLRSQGIACEEEWTDPTEGGGVVESGGCNLVGEPGLFGDKESAAMITIYRSDAFQADLPTEEADEDCVVAVAFGRNWTVVTLVDVELQRRIEDALDGSSACVPG